MDIPDNVFEAALAAEPAVTPEAEPAEPATPAEPAEGEEPKTPEGGEGEGAETPAEPAAPAAPAAEPVAGPTFTLEQVKEVVAAAVDRLVNAPAAKAEEPVAEVVPPHIRAMLESTDANTKAWGQAALEDHRATQAQIGELREFVQTQKFNAIVEQKSAEIDKVQTGFVVVAEVEKPGADGKPQKVVVEQPVTQEMMDKVADYCVEHPDVARVMSVEEVTRRLYPNMVKRSAQSAPSATPAVPAQDGQARRVVKVGTPSAGAGVQANGAAAGRVPRPAPAPSPDETMEQAIARGARALGL